MQQTDLQAGFDPTSAGSSLSFAQLLQMINQMAPQYNVGLIVCQAGPSLNSPLVQGVGGAPDVANNPRFSRYIWLNTYLPAQSPTPYTYNTTDGKWYATPVAPGVIFDAQVAAGANIQISKLLPGTSRYIVRTNAAATSLEFINPNAIFAAGDIPLTALDVSTAPASLCTLQRSAAGVVSWSILNLASVVVNLPVTSITPSNVNGYILQTVAGINTWVATSGFLTDHDISLSKLANSGAATGQVVEWDGVNWSATTIPVTRSFGPYTIAAGDLVSGTAVATGAKIFPAAGGTVEYKKAHGLGNLSNKFYVLRVTAVCVTNDAGYLVGDEVDVNALAIPGANAVTYSLVGNALTPVVNISISSVGGVNFNSLTGANVAFTLANWGLKIYLTAAT